MVPKLALENWFEAPKVALGQGLRFLKWHWGMICGAQSGTEADFVVPKLAPGMQFLPVCRFYVHFLLLLLWWLYSPGWSMASFKIRLHASRSLALSLHSFRPAYSVRGHVIQPSHFSSSFSSCRIQLYVLLFWNFIVFILSM